MAPLAPHAKKIILPVNSLGIVAIVMLLARVVSAQWLWLTFLSWFLISGFGIAIGFHRLFSHAAFTTNPWMRNTLAYLGCLGAQGSPIFWASLHMGAHHPYSDTAKDLHSPVHGYWNSFIGWQIHLKPEQVPFRAGASLLREPFLKFLHKNYYKVYWGTVAVLTLVSWRLALYGFFLPGMISMHQENAVDLFCHIRSGGYRNYETADNSVNNWVLGFFGFGQGWHNNHHARPRDYNFGGTRWYELDICAFLVPLIRTREKNKAIQFSPRSNILSRQDQQS